MKADVEEIYSKSTQGSFSFIKCTFICGYTQPEIWCFVIKFLIQITSIYVVVVSRPTTI